MDADTEQVTDNTETSQDASEEPISENKSRGRGGFKGRGQGFRIGRGGMHGGRGLMMKGFGPPRRGRGDRGRGGDMNGFGPMRRGMGRMRPYPDMRGRRGGRVALMGRAGPMGRGGLMGRGGVVL
ncbi:rRNA 2'-O-methyltransferase fibrillarin-like [Salmo trutta]|uniref:rRNA 2'-O-methyltransferase fibrillarin-like n=1 Tax=Salmo trutta TaxID=8032 RepID=UPI0011304715|nr:rRNA 2'-O-methyltransferase fibrillarin-like [Salmo trutta]